MCKKFIQQFVIAIAEYIFISDNVLDRLNPAHSFSFLCALGNKIYESRNLSLTSDFFSEGFKLSVGHNFGRLFKFQILRIM